MSTGPAWARTGVEGQYRRHRAGDTGARRPVADAVRVRRAGDALAGDGGHPQRDQRGEQPAAGEDVEPGLEHVAQRAGRVAAVVGEGIVVGREQRLVGGDAHHDERPVGDVREHRRVEEGGVIVDVLDHVEQQHQVERPRGLVGGADHPVGEVGGEVRTAVVDVPAHDLTAVGHLLAELAGEPAVPGADVEDAMRAAVAQVVGDEAAEELGPLGLPWVAAHGVAAFGKVHGGIVGREPGDDRFGPAGIACEAS
jgi:hypothetical protein